MAHEQPRLSIVIPVFNSAGVVAQTVKQTCAAMESQNENFEIVLVNDGSKDESWEIIADLARSDARVIAIDLLHNCGQHAANLCGFRQARGEWIVTMDDDLQNPPEEIAKLVAKAEEGHDLVMGKFQQKQHAPYRRIGSKLVRKVNQRIFGQEPDLVLSNFRLIHRDVVDRICAYRGPYPYVPGLCLMYSRKRANTVVEHHPRKVGQSNYNWRRIFTLIAAILFNYSSFPLRLVAAFGGIVAIASFALGLYYLIAGLFSQSSVPGWTTLAVLLAFFNGIIMVMLAMLGEYIVRIISQISTTNPYIVRKKIGADE